MSIETENLIRNRPINCRLGKKTIRVYMEPNKEAINNLNLLVLVLVIISVTYNIMKFIIIFSIIRYSTYTYNGIPPPLRIPYTKAYSKNPLFMSIIYYS